MRHFAQHHINNILFEAQTGSLMHTGYNAFQHQQPAFTQQNWHVPYQQSSVSTNVATHAAIDSALHQPTQQNIWHGQSDVNDDPHKVYTQM